MNVAGKIAIGAASAGTVALAGAGGYFGTKAASPDFEKNRTETAARRDSAAAKLADPNGRYSPSEVDQLHKDSSAKLQKNPLGVIPTVAGGVALLGGGFVARGKYTTIDLEIHSYAERFSGRARIIGATVALAGAALIGANQLEAAHRRAGS